MSGEYRDRRGDNNLSIVVRRIWRGVGAFAFSLGTFGSLLLKGLCVLPLAFIVLLPVAIVPVWVITIAIGLFAVRRALIAARVIETLGFLGRSVDFATRLGGGEVPVTVTVTE